MLLSVPICLSDFIEVYLAYLSRFLSSSFGSSPRQDRVPGALFRHAYSNPYRKSLSGPGYRQRKPLPHGYGYWLVLPERNELPLVFHSQKEQPLFSLFSLVSSVRSRSASIACNRRKRNHKGPSPSHLSLKKHKDKTGY